MYKEQFKKRNKINKDIILSIFMMLNYHINMEVLHHKLIKITTLIKFYLIYQHLLYIIKFTNILSQKDYLV